MPGGAVCGKADIVSMIEFRDGRWNSEQRVSHPGTFNANPVSSAAGSAMLRLVQTGEHHVHADALAERLVPALNEVLAKAGAPGAVYGWASRFHITLGKEVERPEGMRWTAETPPPATDIALVVGMKRAMLNHGVDLMGGNGGFTSGVHTDADIEATIEAFAATVQDLQADGLL
jgi:glutamate-1-semialdehyde 2,1-aminomutase